MSAMSPASQPRVKPSRTAGRPATRRNRRPRPARSMTVGPVVRGCFAIRLTVGKDVFHYFVEPIAADFGLGVRLRKFVQDVVEGEPDHYDVNLVPANPTASTCECAGFLRHGFHRDADGVLCSCKHLDSLLALAAQGRLPAQQSAAGPIMPARPMCAVCHGNPVDAEGGFDTCDECLACQ